MTLMETGTDTEMITIEEMSERSGVSLAALMYRADNGILVRANEKRRGVKRLFWASDVEAMRTYAGRNAYLEQFAEMRRQIEASGERACNLCQKVKPLEAFAKQAKGIGGRQSRCKDCQRPLWSDYGKKNREACTQRRRDYERRNREKALETRRVWQRRVYKTNTPAKRAMVLSRERHRRRQIAIAYGKSSPICREHGFALVTNEITGQWRAARLDKPIESGERAICHYLYGVAGVRKWIVLPAPLARERDMALIAALQKKEAGRG